MNMNGVHDSSLSFGLPQLEAAHKAGGARRWFYCISCIVDHIELRWLCMDKPLQGLSTALLYLRVKKLAL